VRATVVTAREKRYQVELRMPLCFVCRRVDGRCLARHAANSDSHHSPLPRHIQNTVRVQGESIKELLIKTEGGNASVKKLRVNGMKSIWAQRQDGESHE
jgi:hypothetical protein